MLRGIIFLIPLLSAHAQLPLNHECYRILQTDASYTCDIRAGTCQALPAGTLEWQETAYQTTLSDGSTALVDPYCQFVDNSDIPVCIWLRARMIPNLKLVSGPTLGVAFHFIYIDVDFDQDGVEREKGYTFVYSDNALAHLRKAAIKAGVMRFRLPQNSAMAR